MSGQRCGSLVLPFQAASKVAAASLALMASVVSTSDKLPPAAAAKTAEAADLSSGNSPMTNQSWRPNVKYQPMSLPTAAFEQIGDGLFPILRLGKHALDSVCRELASGDVDGHGISPAERWKVPVFAPYRLRLYARSQTDTRAFS
jgi:hypothetical protein